MFYPPKGAAKAEPEWGPIVFTYVLLFRVVVQERTLMFQKPFLEQQLY